MPKQLLRVIRGKSLLQYSYERLRGILPPEQIYVCTGEVHRKSVEENLPELPKQNLLGEPTGRDTANAVGFPAAILQKRDKDAVFAIVTADHVIEPVDVFQKAIITGFEVAEKQPNAIVTFGIVPSHGHTGLGYVHRADPLPGFKGVYKVQSFKEKPDKPTADRYVESGRYYWNSGMFVWRADTVLNELGQHLPESRKGLDKIAAAWDTPQQNQVLNETYSKLPKISIDYAVMEPASQGKGKAQVMVVEMPVKWLDVGSWTALAETFEMDKLDNSISAPALSMIDSENNIIVSSDPEHLISLIGVTDMIVIHTPDATMICPKEEAQRVKELVGKVKDQYGNKYH
jgi:mannose-1-phosphate guanylyltransferase